MKIILFIQCFPPLLCYAGGVSKRYLKLCKVLIEEYNYDITIITPIDIEKSKDNAILKYINSGKLIHKSIDGIIANTLDGKALGINIFSFNTLNILIKELYDSDLCIVDDIIGRQYIDIICNIFNVPVIFTTHTDVTKLRSFRYKLVKWIWYFHNKFINKNILSTCSEVFAKQVNIKYTWPILIWSNNFKKINKNKTEKIRDYILKEIKRKNKSEYKFDGILFNCGRWSREKRLELIIPNIPHNLLLIIIGDTHCEEYYQKLLDISNKYHNILLLKGMLNSKELSIYYNIADLYLSASDFETCGNTLVESWACGTPVAVQPAQGHLEYLESNVNGFSINFDKKNAKKEIEKAFNNIETLDLTKIQSKINNNDFGSNYHKNLIHPALEIKHTYLESFFNSILFLIILIFILPLVYLFSLLLEYIYKGLITKTTQYTENE